MLDRGERSRVGFEETAVVTGLTQVERIEKAGHKVAAREIVKDDVKKIRKQVKKWIADKKIDVVISTGGTGFTGRDVTPEAVEPLFEKRMDAFAAMVFTFSIGSITSLAVTARKSTTL